MKNFLFLVVAGIATASGQIVVDGDPSEWTGTAPAVVNSSLYSSQSAGTTNKLNEWIWRDVAGDFRTDFGFNVYDLLEVRLASDGTNLYYLCKLPPNQIASPAILEISLRRPGSTSTQRILPGFTDTMVPEAAAWDFVIVTPAASGGSLNKVWNPVFSLATVGSYAQNLTTGMLEGSVPWSALGGQPGSLTFLFTFSLYCGLPNDDVAEIGDASVSNCLDCVTTTAGITWAAVSSGSLDYAAPIQFLGDDEVLPIRLASFTAIATVTGDVRMEWTTLSELNNYGMYVERKCAGESDFVALPGGFVPGRGPSTTPSHYVYTDANASPGENLYRLRQVDLDGTTRFSEPVRVSVTVAGRGEVPGPFALFQNYPNPFNPSTGIRYALQTKSFATMTVFNALGQTVATLFNEIQESGIHDVRFDAGGLASGVYFYRLRAGERTATMKFILAK